MELKTIKLSEKGQISIPKEVRKGMHLKNGDRLVLMTKGEQIILQKAELFLKKLSVEEESIGTIMLSEGTLKKEWNNKYDERWNKNRIIGINKIQRIEQKLQKYFELTLKALKKVKIPANLDIKSKKSAEDFLDLSQRYFDDAKYFEKKGDLINAYGAVVYAHAFLDAGARLGLFNVGKDNQLFMVD